MADKKIDSRLKSFCKALTPDQLEAVNRAFERERDTIDSEYLDGVSSDPEYRDNCRRQAYFLDCLCHTVEGLRAYKKPPERPSISDQ